MRQPTGEAVAPLRWDSPKPKPGGSATGNCGTLEFEPSVGRTDAAATIRVEYRLHTYNRMQREQDEYRFWQTVAAVVLLPTTLFAMVLVVRFLQRERRRELDRWRSRGGGRAPRDANCSNRGSSSRRPSTRERNSGGRCSNSNSTRRGWRAAPPRPRTRRSNCKSQLYASIGIMAGSYAHNIKNLLVRPNDLLARCLESDGVPGEQQGMLQEVKSTLGTVTERLQQILRTVRRDPANTEMTRVDLAALVRESQRTWAEMGREKWKLAVTAEVPREPLWVNGDLSHLQQAVENLLFNARDATFEMRNYLRDEAKREPDPATRRQKLLDAAAWRGEVGVRLSRDGDDGRAGGARQRHRHDRGGAAELPQDALHHQARQRALRGVQRRDGPGAVVRGDGAGTPRGGTRDRVRPAARHDVPRQVSAARHRDDHRCGGATSRMAAPRSSLSTRTANRSIACRSGVFTEA